MKFCDLINLLTSFNNNMLVSVYNSDSNRYLKLCDIVSDDLFYSKVKEFTYSDNKLNVVL